MSDETMNIIPVQQSITIYKLI